MERRSNSRSCWHHHVHKAWVLMVLVWTQSAVALTIVIDPGHGGDDVGARASRYNSVTRSIETVTEKELTLAFATRVYRQLVEQGYNVYLTRSSDRMVTLNERAQLVEKVGADYFVSIHMNSAPSSLAHGFEVYFLDNHNDVAAKKVEKVENSASSNSEDRVVNQILIDLVIEKTVDSSKRLAQTVHDDLLQFNSALLHQKDRGVRPGLFYVLALAKVPAILVEVGFMSHPEELFRLRDANFQNSFATALASGIKRSVGPPVKVAAMASDRDRR